MIEFIWFVFFFRFVFSLFDTQDNLLQSRPRNLVAVINQQRVVMTITKQKKGTGQGSPILRKGSGFIMKKTLLALAIAATATSVNAAEIYANDDTKVGLKGEVDIYLTTSEVDQIAGGSKKEEADVSTWAKIQLDAEQKLNDQFTAFASFEIESKGSDAKFDDVLVGF